jgi:hypothetical protein
MDPVLVALGVAILAKSGKRRAGTGQSADAGGKKDAPPVFAYLYQLPDDAFATTRMAFGETESGAQEMGIFDSPDAARKVAESKGWRMAWDGVRQLKARPA